MKADAPKAADLPAIVLALLGEPIVRGNPYWRYGRQRSLRIHMPTGRWFDFEAWKSGYLADLVLRGRGGTRDEAQTWLAEQNYTSEDAARLEAKVKADEARNQARQAKARNEAERLVKIGAELYGRYPKLAHTHDYLRRKGIAHLDLGLTVVSQSDTSIRGIPEGHVLIVPMRDYAGVLHSVEAIAGNGDKRFLKGGRTAGCFFPIGDDGALVTVLVCEGLATGASLYEATGLPVVVCFSCGNMAAVARIFAQRGSRVVVCGDDDWSKPKLGKSNVGKESAIALHKELKRRPGGDHALALPEFPGVERFDDHTDFNDSARACGLDAVRNVIERAIAPKPDESGQRREKDRKNDRQNDKRKSAILVCAEDVIMTVVDWLWEGHLARGMLEILTGVPGVGKSQVQADNVACVTTGRDWPNGNKGIGEGLNAIMLIAEDALGNTVVPRLVAAGADRSRVFFLPIIRVDNQERSFLLREDIDVLEAAIVEKNAGLVTIDPITAYLGSGGKIVKFDSHRATDVREILTPLAVTFERTRTAGSILTHPAKNTSNVQRAIDQFIGSQAFVAIPRIGHLVVEEMVDGKETGRMLYTNPKYSVHAPMPTLAYRMAPSTVGLDPTTGNPIISSHVVWEKEPVQLTADQALAATARKGKQEDRGAKAAAERFLRETLANGPMAMNEVIDAGKAHCIALRTLERAKVDLGIKSVRPGGQGKWHWALPEEPTPKYQYPDD
jgi:putative DNA primase/helicase